MNKRFMRGLREWVEGTIEFCVAIAEVREQFTTDTAFNQWCEDNGFDEKVINHQDRAAAIVMGRDPVALRVCLETSKRWLLPYNEVITGPLGRDPVALRNYLNAPRQIRRWSLWHIYKEEFSKFVEEPPK